MDYEKFKVREYTHWTVYLDQNQCYLGRMYIWAKRNPPELIDLMRDTTEEERKELFEIGKAIEKALTFLFKPDLFNWASLGNLEIHGHHLHMHVIPRYKTTRGFGEVIFEDKNWSANYTPYDKDFTIPEEAFAQLKALIVEALTPAPPAPPGDCCGGNCHCR